MFRVIWVASALGLFLASAEPTFAQYIHRSEPLVLPPYGVALVHDNRCSVGKVMKVTGAIRGLRRKKTCIPHQTSQAFAGPY